MTLLAAIALACATSPPPKAADPQPSPAEAPSTSSEATDEPPQGCHPEAADGRTSSEINTLGYRCYKAGDLPAAAQLFGAAVEVDDTHALAHYNLACTLALLRARGEVCERGAYEETILEHLERAVALDEGRRARMKEDSDLDGIRSTVRYRVLAGADLTDEAQLRQALESTIFYGPAMGVYGSTTKLALRAGGEAALMRLDVDAEGGPAWGETGGRWTVRAGKLDVEIDQESWTFEVTPQGELKNRDGVQYRNSPDECGA